MTSSAELHHVFSLWMEICIENDFSPVRSVDNRALVNPVIHYFCPLNARVLFSSHSVDNFIFGLVFFKVVTRYEKKRSLHSNM